MAKSSVAVVRSFGDRGYESPQRGLIPAHGLGTPDVQREVEVQRSIIGLSLPYLPDFLADHTLVGQNDSERLAEVLERQVQFVTNLWKWQSAAFSLRFVYDPQKVAVEVALLGRILSRPADAQIAVAQLSRDLLALAQTYSLPAKELASPEELERLRLPALTQESSASANLTIVEVRQREDVVIFPWVKGGEGYVVYPYWEPSGTYLQVFEALLRQTSPCVVNLHIEPTRLADSEYQALVGAAATAQTASDWQRSAYSVEYSGRWADPQAAVIARVFAAQLRRLSQPFVIVAQVASCDEFVAMSIAQTLGVAFRIRSSSTLRGDEDLPSGFEVVYPATPAEAQAATRTLHHLILTPWGRTASAASPGLARLRYLADARGAAALFRFPVAVHGGVPGIEVRQRMPDFETGGRRRQIRPEDLHLGSFQRGGAVTLRVKDLSRHGLVAGMPGSGKTNTCLYLLSQLHERHIPFMVIEPIKTEYRGLARQAGFEDLLIFTLGDETTAPFRLNPFELLPGVRLEVHLEALNVAINAALPQFGVLPTIVEEALEEVYSLHGWSLTDRGGEGGPRLFPTMAEFYRTAIQVVEGRGYRGELHDNIRAAVKGRIGSLLRGSKGRMFNCRRSLPLKLLLERPVVLELDSLNDDAKALSMMFLLILLREYRQVESRQSSSLHEGLQHLMVIEEAHRIMENVASVSNPEVSADTRARAVRMLTDFLVEMRAYGQGLLIAEQSPEKLAPDAVRNTNLKIGHMLPGREDREALAAAMIMDEEQERFLGKLRVGQASAFMAGFEKATFLTVPDYKGGAQFADFLPDEIVRSHMAPFYREHRLAFLPFDGCGFCGEPCAHREAIEPMTREKEVAWRFQEAMLLFDQRPDPADFAANWRAVAQACLAAAAQAGKGGVGEAAYCYFCHGVDFPFTEHMRREFVKSLESLPAFG